MKGRLALWILTEDNVAVPLSFGSLVYVIICFDSLINYYLRICRNEFFVNAVDEEMKGKE